MRTSATEGPAFGAALLAGVGADIWANIPEACEATIRPLDTVQPDSRLTERYTEGYGLYQELYPALKDLYARGTTLG